jgi:GNAT superfamily N-acetyltransferase
VAIGFHGFNAWAPEGWEPPDELTPDNVERLRRELADPRAFALMAMYEGDPVGHVLWMPARESREPGAALVPGLVHLRHLFVLEPWWGTGIARELHARAVAAMRETGWELARLFTPAANARARRFYDREGWVAGPPFFEPGLDLDLVEYRLDLAG